MGKVDIFWRPLGSNDAPFTSIRYLISSDLMRYLLMKHHKQQNQQHWFLFAMAANSWCFVEIIVNCPQQSRVTKSTQMHWKPPSSNVWPWVEYSQSCWIFSTLGCKKNTALRYQLKHQLYVMNIFQYISSFKDHFQSTSMLMNICVERFSMKVFLSTLCSWQLGQISSQNFVSVSEKCGFQVFFFCLPSGLPRCRYRMHTLLSAFPSQQFYDGQLEDAEGKTPESLAAFVMGRTNHRSVYLSSHERMMGLSLKIRRLEDSFTWNLRHHTFLITHLRLKNTKPGHSTSLWW